MESKIIKDATADRNGSNVNDVGDISNFSALCTAQRSVHVVPYIENLDHNTQLCPFEMNGAFNTIGLLHSGWRSDFEVEITSPSCYQGVYMIGVAFTKEGAPWPNGLEARIRKSLELVDMNATSVCRFTIRYNDYRAWLNNDAPIGRLRIFQIVRTAAPGADPAAAVAIPQIIVRIKAINLRLFHAT